MSPGFWVLPTLKRPHNMERLLASYREVEETANVVVYLWGGDPCIEEYLALPWPEEWDRIVVPEEFTAAGAMRMAFESAPDAEFYGFLADDVVFKTPWSTPLREAAVPYFVAWPDDGIQGPQLPTHFVCGGDLVRAIGWWAIPGIEHSGLDLAWVNIGANCSGLLRYCPHVRFEHMHHFVQKAPRDEVYDKALGLLKEDDKRWRSEENTQVLRSAVREARRLLWRQGDTSMSK